MNNIITTLQAAIDRSRSHDECVRVEFAGDRSDLLAELRAIYDGNIDDVRENEGTIDVWGYTDDMMEGVQDWRLCVTLTGPKKTYTT